MALSARVFPFCEVTPSTRSSEDTCALFRLFPIHPLCHRHYRQCCKELVAGIEFHGHSGEHPFPLGRRGDPAVPALPAPLPTEKLRDAVDLIVVPAVGKGQKLIEKLAQPGRVPGKDDTNPLRRGFVLVRAGPAGILLAI